MLFFAAGRVPEQDRLGSVLELAVEKDGALNRLHLVLGIVLLVGDEETRVQVLLVRQRVAFLLRRTVHDIALLDRLVQTGVFNYCDLLYDFDVLDALPHRVLDSHWLGVRVHEEPAVLDLVGFNFFQH